MSKMKRMATYQIDLKRIQVAEWEDDPTWAWKLTLTGCFVHSGTASYRWTALWKARRAARRHIRGKVIEKVKIPKPDTVYYAIEARR